ncbi:MAG: SRPBCC family protein [Chitinophagaceae bacterium]|nr:SRPBCC family protein [Chitinophagaceae bacterium]
MNKMIKKILLALLGIIVVYLCLCPLGPKKLDVETVKVIAKTPEQVYATFSDFKTWPRWSKWILEDPEMKLTFSEPSSGLGSEYSWESKQSGNGRMKLVACSPNESIDYALYFDGMSPSKTSIRLKPIPEGTEIHWRMYSEDAFPFVLRGMMWMANMNQRIKDDFNRGIDNMAKLK